MNVGGRESSSGGNINNNNSSVGKERITSPNSLFSVSPPYTSHLSSLLNQSLNKIPVVEPFRDFEEINSTEGYYSSYSSTPGNLTPQSSSSCSSLNSSFSNLTIHKDNNKKDDIQIINNNIITNNINTNININSEHNIHTVNNNNNTEHNNNNNDTENTVNTTNNSNTEVEIFDDDILPLSKSDSTLTDSITSTSTLVHTSHPLPTCSHLQSCENCQNSVQNQFNFLTSQILHLQSQIKKLSTTSIKGKGFHLKHLTHLRLSSSEPLLRYETSHHIFYIKFKFFQENISIFLKFENKGKKFFEGIVEISILNWKGDWGHFRRKLKMEKLEENKMKGWKKYIEWRRLVEGEEKEKEVEWLKDDSVVVRIRIVPYQDYMML